MTDKYIELLGTLPFDILHIAHSYATDAKSQQIEPAHLFRSLLHKDAGLIHFIEDTLDEDYFYLVDWCDIHIQLCDKSSFGTKGFSLSHSAQLVIKEAEAIGKVHGITGITAITLMAALVSPGVGFTSEQLKTMPLKADKITASLAKETVSATDKKNNTQTSQTNSQNIEYCTPYLSNLPTYNIIGFQDEIRSLIDVLARKDRANILIVGETGIGKTSLLVGLFQMATAHKLPASLSKIDPFELDLISLSQGVSYKGEIEDRFKKVIEFLSDKEHPILIIENFHRIEEKQSLLNGIIPILTKSLSNGHIHFICTTTVDGYTKDIERDKELMSFFEKISISVPSEASAVEILQSKCQLYEDFHHISIDPDVPQEIVRLSKRYIADRNLPSSAIDLLDRSMASAKISNEIASSKNDGIAPIQSIQKSNIRDTISKMTGIPIGNIQCEEKEKLINAEDTIRKRVVGQNHAIKSVLEAIYESRSGLNKKGQPIGSFFFLGPTGTGKTELAKALAEFLFNDENEILRFDMSEYKEEHSVALLYGAPPGYVGYEEGGILVNQIRQHPYSVVLFDEIEKAHKSVFDIFLQILDEGKLHDRLGKVGDFSNALIIFTSNIGSEFIFKAFETGKIPSHDQMLEVMQGQFRPEFLARLTEIVPFAPITGEIINQIFNIHIKNVLKMLQEQNISLEIDESARHYITDVGFNAHYGARPILGIIRKEIRRPLSKLIISGDVKTGDHIIMKYDDTSKEIIWDIESDE